MTTVIDHPQTFRPGPLMGQVLSCAMAGSLLGLGVGYAAGWAEGSLSRLGVAAVAAATVWGVASFIGGVFLVLNTQRQVTRLGLGVLASSTARMFAALIFGLGMYFLLPFDGRTFWTSFLLAGLLALIAETAWALRTLNPARGVAPSAAGAR